MTFEKESAGEHSFVDSGVNFSGVIATCNVNAFCPAFPPVSGVNTLAGVYGVTGVHVAFLDTTKVVCEVSAYATGLSSTHMDVYDQGGRLIGTVETGDRNELEPGVTLAPNFLLKIRSTDKSIGSVTFSAPNSGDDFEIDNFSFSGPAGNSSPNPPGQTNPIVIPILAQDDPQWVSVGYDDTDTTIGQDGCFLTDITMLIDFFAHQQNINFSTTPPALNNYLDAQPNGYFETYNGTPVPQSGQVNPGDVVNYAAAQGINVNYTFFPPTEANVDNFLQSGIPVMLNVSGGGNGVADHWVIATGTTTVNGQQTYSIVDPSLSYGSPTSTLLERYGGNYYGDPFVMAPPGPYGPAQIPPVSGGAFNVGAHSPVELRITDPQGRTTGKADDGSTVLYGIPHSSYFPFVLGDDTTPLHTVHHSLPVVKSLTVQSPSIGLYQLVARGTGSGSFTLVFNFSDSRGNDNRKQFTGTAILGSRSTFTFRYDPVLPAPAVTAECPADVDGNGTVDRADLMAISSRLGSTPKKGSYLQAADLNEDGVIDVRDLAFASRTLGCKRSTF